MKVILFGGAGYIGTHVALSFLERGDEVGIYDNLSTGLESNVSPDAKFYLGDILDRDRVREVLSEGWDVAVHLAAFKAAPCLFKIHDYILRSIFCRKAICVIPVFLHPARALIFPPADSLCSGRPPCRL